MSAILNAKRLRHKDEQIGRVSHKTPSAYHAPHKIGIKSCVYFRNIHSDFSEISVRGVRQDRSGGAASLGLWRLYPSGNVSPAANEWQPRGGNPPTASVGTQSG
jgi:hypothetical protein